MSNRELAMRLLNSLPDYKLGYVLAYLQGLTAEETDDDAYCAQLYTDYLARSENEAPAFIDLEEAARAAGVEL